METTPTIDPPSDAKDQDTILVLDKETKEVDVVKGVDSEGKLQKTAAQKNNEADFIRIDKSGDFFSNFFSNFLRQLKNPTSFSFFKISLPEAVETASQLNDYVKNSSDQELGRLKEYELDQNTLTHKNQNKMETTPNNNEKQYRYQPEQIDWDTMSKFGLNQEKLEKMKALDPLLRGFKTNDLIPVTINLGTAVSRMDVRLSLQTNDTGDVVINIHGIRKEPNLNFKFLGHEFSEEDKKNLLTNGNMGRVVDLVNPKTDEIIPSIISRDRLTNELVALRAEKIKIPDEIKGVQLNEEQKLTLMEGKPLYLENMISTKGEPFDATVQFNADKRYVEFLFDQNPKVGQTNNQSVSVEPPRVFRDKELDDKQYEKLKSGQTIYVDGLIDKKGEAYKGYVTFNKETGTTDFSFKNPNAAQEKMPSEEHKTQVAVNSEGKTDETAKNLKQPMKSGQTGSESAKQKEQEKPKVPAKAKGRKI